MISYFSSIAVLAFAGSCAAFSTTSRSTKLSLSSVDTTLPATDASANSETRLTFVSKFATDSSPIPAASREDTINFFKDPDNFSFGASMPSSIVEPTPELMQRWRQACIDVDAMLPTEQDAIMNVRTVGVSIPGITIEWSAYIGTKLRMKDDGYPMLEFVLIKDELSAKGLRPVTYIFDRITGSRKGNVSSGNKTRETYFLSTIAIQPPSINDGQSSCPPSTSFHCNGFMEIGFRIPSVLFRLIGKDKSQSEERMGKTIGKAIAKDMKKALRTWEESYLQWIDEHATY